MEERLSEREEQGMTPAEDREETAAPEAPTPTESNAPRVEWTDEHQRELQRIVAKETAAAERRAKARLEAERERQEAEARGEYQKLLAAAERERDEARNALRLAEAERVVDRTARRLGANHPDLVYRLIREDLQFDETGAPVNADDLVAALKRDYPTYFAPPVAGADGGKSGKAVDTDDMDRILRRAAGRA